MSRLRKRSGSASMPCSRVTVNGKMFLGGREPKADTLRIHGVDTGFRAASPPMIGKMVHVELDRLLELAGTSRFESAGRAAPLLRGADAGK